MGDVIRIQLMGKFAIYVNENRVDQLETRSRKGAALIEYLLVHRGKPVENSRLLDTLWGDESGANPENAMRTLVSRLRVLLNKISPNLGSCVVSNRGAYYWQCLPGMSVDLYEIDQLFERLDHEPMDDEARIACYAALCKLYSSNLLQESKSGDWIRDEATTLRERYINAVLDYIDLLKQLGRHNEIISVCRRALEVEHFDDRLHMELMKVLVKTSRTGEALQQYKHVTDINYRYLGVQPSEELQAFYKQLVTAGKTLELNLDAIRNELQENAAQSQAFVCEYIVFKEIFNLQMRNLERLGASMFLMVVMVRPYDGQVLDAMRQDRVMTDLLEILRDNLRKGDVITRFAPAIFALMLPTVNYKTGALAMERIKKVFYQKYPNSNIVIEYRVGPLSSEEALNSPDEPEKH